MVAYDSRPQHATIVMRTNSKSEDSDYTSYLYPIVTDIDDGCNDDCIDDEEDIDEEDSPRCDTDVFIGHSSTFPQPQHGTIRNSSKFHQDFIIIREVSYQVLSISKIQFPGSSHSARISYIIYHVTSVAD